MIQLTTAGPRIVKDDGWAARQREFAQRHCVVLEGFLDQGILGRVPRMQKAQEAGRFFIREYSHKNGEVFGREFEQLRTERLSRVFFLLLNQPRLFEDIAEFTGSEVAIRRFSGRYFMKFPGGEHFDDWHDDCNYEGTPFGLTINLSPKPCGSGFQIRNKKTKEVFQTVTGTRFGDACLFRIHESLEPRGLPVEGPAPRHIYGGWFRSAGIDYREMVRETVLGLGDQADSL